MGTLRQDIKYAFRLFLRRPSWTAAALATLALGMGATTAIYGVVHSVLVRPLPYPGADRIVSASQVDATTGEGLDAVTFPWYEAWLERQDVLASLGPYATQIFTLNQQSGSERVTGAVMGSAVMEVLKVSPIHGRRFTADDDVVGADPVVLLSHGAWQRRYGGRTDVVGSTVTLNERVRTVVGVMPPGFAFPEPGTEYWLPLSTAYRAPGTAYLSLLARLPDDVSIDAARAALAGQTRVSESAEPEELRLEIRTLQETLVGDVRRVLLIFLGAVGVLLLVATLNVANLMLVRSAERGLELDIRAALGAGRARLARLHLTEGMVLTLVAAALGTALAAWLVGGFGALSPELLPRSDEIRIDPQVLAFTVALAAAVGLAVAIAPAVRAGRADLAARLRAGGVGGVGGGAGRLRSGIVVAQVALATVLLAAGGLLLRSFVELWTVDEGLRLDGVAVIGVMAPGSRYPEVEQRRAFYQSLMERFENTPEFRSAALVSFLPYTGARTVSDLLVEGRAGPPPGEESGSTEVLFVSPSYFGTLGVSMRHGRLFEAADTESGLPVAVINETLARRLWPDEGAAIGRRIQLEDDTWRTVIGVAADTRQHGLHDPPTGLAYIPYAQAGERWPFAMNVLARTADGLERAAPAARALVASIDPNAPVASIAWLDDSRSASVAEPRLRAVLVGAFALLALALAVVGVYGVMAYAAARRTREVGIRLALGANRGRIVGAMMRDALVLTAMGLAIGLLGSLAAGRVLEGWLFGIGARDLVTLVITGTLLAGSALLAAYLPARRATRLEPVQALRTE